MSRSLDHQSMDGTDQRVGETARKAGSYVRHEPRGVAVHVITGTCEAVDELRDLYLRMHGRAALKFEQWDRRNNRATIEIEDRASIELRRAA